MELKEPTDDDGVAIPSLFMSLFKALVALL